jgi:hypothetical protein
MPIHVDLMLASAATPDASGGVSVLSAGWQVRPAEPLVPSAIVAILRVPRKQAGTHELTIQLFDYDDNPITVDPPEGPGLMQFSASIDVSGLRDAELRSPLLANYAINLPPFRLEPGTEYLWRVHVDAKTRPHWVLPFRTMTLAEQSHLGMPPDRPE